MSHHLLAHLPARLEPIGRMLMQQWLCGSMTTSEFLAWLHVPNCDYQPTAPSLLGPVERQGGASEQQH